MSQLASLRRVITQVNLVRYLANMIFAGSLGNGIKLNNFVVHFADHFCHIISKHDKEKNSIPNKSFFFHPVSYSNIRRVFSVAHVIGTFLRDKSEGREKTPKKTTLEVESYQLDLDTFHY